ncbi:MAG TPA: glutamine-hydrolyzing carbamoyl-phosphate synthase small subunit [Candidatus Saccharimonadales bacterium]|nr:glutamine-hydrolyzing carbamoyl-phosphate synthase small subunit [Candidatus Saccharimonadales bacterium]
MTLGALVLKDGTVFEGQIFGEQKLISSGEVVFHTGLSGYQEILTDPSYAGQIISFTYPHIGNYGINEQDNESRKIYARGLIIRDFDPHFSNYSATQSLDTWLKANGISGIYGLDTRKLTRHIRGQGALPGAFGTADKNELLKAARIEVGTANIDLVQTVSTSKRFHLGRGKLRVTALDFGIKESILKFLSSFATVTVLPANATAKQVLDSRPNGIFLSNGPGDPGVVNYAVTTIGELLGKAPIFGICLGHQLLATALGGQTQKMPFGHHGANHPVKNLQTNRIEITSQNHSFTVVESSLRNVTVTHRNLNDHTIEGLKSTKYPAFSVQFHPEAGPGPHETSHLFNDFKLMMEHYA